MFGHPGEKGEKFCTINLKNIYIHISIKYNVGILYFELSKILNFIIDIPSNSFKSIPISNHFFKGSKIKKVISLLKCKVTKNY